MSLLSDSTGSPRAVRRSIGPGRVGRAHWLAVALVLTLGACSSGPDGRRIGSNPPVQGGYKVGVPYQINGVWYYPKEDFNYDRIGIASWYGHPFHGRASASGERYDMEALTAAHKTLPMPSLVEVTNLENGRRAVLRINDRGPFVSGRIIDVSRAAARKLGFKGNGIAKVRVRVLVQESRQMKQLALANMNGRARALAARRQRETGSGAQVAAKPPEFQPVAQPPERSAVRPPVRVAERPAIAPVAPVRAGDAAQTNQAAKQKDQYAAPSHSVRKRRNILVSDLPPSGDRNGSAGQGVYRAQPAKGSDGSAASSGASHLGRVAGRREHTARPKASAIHAARPAAPRVAPKSRATGSELPGRIFVQAGAFRDRGNAYRMRSRLAGMGSVQVVPVRVGGARYFRVRVGPVGSARQGNRLLARIVDAGYPRAQIVID
jgi:peptidoglycan lytic transglycosylase